MIMLLTGIAAVPFWLFPATQAWKLMIPLAIMNLISGAIGQFLGSMRNHSSAVISGATLSTAFSIALFALIFAYRLDVPLLADGLLAALLFPLPTWAICYFHRYEPEEADAAVQRAMTLSIAPAASRSGHFFRFFRHFSG